MLIVVEIKCYTLYTYLNVVKFCYICVYYYLLSLTILVYVIIIIIDDKFNDLTWYTHIDQISKRFSRVIILFRRSFCQVPIIIGFFQSIIRYGLIMQYYFIMKHCIIKPDLTGQSHIHCIINWTHTLKGSEFHQQ